MELIDTQQLQDASALVPSVLLAADSGSPSFFEYVGNLPTQVKVRLRKVFEFLNVLYPVVINAIWQATEDVNAQGQRENMACSDASDRSPMLSA